MTTKAKIGATLAAAALVVPAAAAAKRHEHPGHPGHPAHGGKGHASAHGAHSAHPVSFIFKGTYGEGGMVSVAHGNAHARHAGLVGQDVTLDLTSTRIVAADSNGDGLVDASDLLAGDRVLVQARLPRGESVTQPVAARRVIDQSAGEDESTDAPDEGDDLDDGGEEG